LKTILVIGKSGQLAWELSELSSPEVRLIFLGRNEINITSKKEVFDTLVKYSPNSVINAAAYTAVDLAEKEKDKAYLINAIAVGYLAETCKTLSIHLTHISTDFVFDGSKSSPYLVGDAINPISVYGASKAEGEALLKKHLSNEACIIRTSWVYSTHGNNFVKTMLRLMQEKTELGIISDQVGTPTYAKGLAQACLFSAINKITGTHHWTDYGVASWYDFAVVIQEIAYKKKILKKRIPISPIRTQDYPTPAKRPSYSLLDKQSLTTSFAALEKKHWSLQFEDMLGQLLKTN